MKNLFLPLALFVLGSSAFGQFEVQYAKGDKTLGSSSATGKLFKDAPKEIVITDFRVEYRLFKGESVSGTSASSLTGSTYQTSANMNVWLQGLDDAGMLKNTNEIYNKFVNDLEAKGYKVEVIDAEKIKTSKKFLKDKDAKILNGSSYDKVHKKVIQSRTFIPEGVNVVSMSDPASPGPMAAMKEGQVLNDVFMGREVLRLNVTVTVDFFDFEKKGIIKKVSLSGAPVIHIGGEHPSNFGLTFINKKFKFGTFGVTPNHMMYVDANDYWASDMVETKSFEFMGSKLKNNELIADPSKYFEISKLAVDAYLTKCIEMYEVFLSGLK